MSAAVDGADAQSAHDGWSLFDGRADTGLTARSSAPVRVRLTLAEPAWLEQIAVLGDAQGQITVRAESGGMLQSLDGLTDLRLDELGSGWGRFRASQPIRTRELIVEWVPSGERGPREIVLLARAAARHGVSERELADRVLAGSVPGSISVASPTPDLDVSRLSGAQSFSVQLPADPRALGRAFLVYELRGLGHWLNTRRRINGGAVAGGVTSKPSDGGLQVEEIAPDWLRRGDNRIEFLPVDADVAPGYRVRQLRIVGVPHANVVQAPATLRDRYELQLEGLTQPHSLAFHLSAATSARLELAAVPYQRRQSWALFGLRPGWHHFDIDPALPATDRLSLRLKGGNRSATLTELQVTGSTRHQQGPRLQVTYPLHGECKDGKARIAGFVGNAATDDSVDLKIAGRSVALSADGSFSIEVAENRLESADSWQVRLEAGRGGERVSRVLPLGRCEGQATGPAVADGLIPDEGAPFAQLVTPERAATLSFAGARLEIPAGAVSKPTRISIRPLVGDQVQPMDREMQNVTPLARAFRFGPHGMKFEKPIKITLPYDSAAFAPGLSEQDLYTLYFEENRRAWTRIGRFERAESAELTSLTDHFTDFVNATIAQPDAPGSRSFNPNEMKGLELARPSAGVSMIEPPEASSRGSARLSHMLELPPGRNGMQPDLDISYDSDAQNGWLGVGWDLRLSSIEIDTRFGVPTYQGAERYLLDGEQLTPCTTDLQQLGPCATVDPNRFVRRTEGIFDRIERTGDAPENYAFIVTNKSGTKFIYGQTAQARLSDPTLDSGPIFRWYLERVEDTFGNAITYEYWQDRGDNGEPFVQCYPRHIHYTSHPQREAAYHVDFYLEGDNRGTPQPEPTARPDVLITGRSGFQVLTRYRLGSIDVRLDEDEIIRTYELSYDPEADFQKSMLEAIALHGLGVPEAPGQVLYEHRFEYYKAERDSGNVKAFGDSYQKWGNSHRQDDGLTRTEDETKGGSAGGGIGIGPISLTASGGGFFGTDRVRLSTLDLDGDGMPDLLDHRGRASFNRLRGVPADDHLSASDIFGLTSNGLGFTERTGWMVQAGLHVSGFSGGIGYTRSTTEDEKIVADVNGDGWPDLVNVSDNRISVRPGDGRGNFLATSNWGTVPLDQAPSGLGEFAADPAVKAAFHLVDPLVRWTAPFDGQITIGGALSKRQVGGDGVVAQIFHNQQELWRREVAGDDTSSCAIGGGNSCSGSGLGVTVGAGDHIYIKLNANNTPALADDPLRVNLAFDDVDWQPTIAYNVDASLQNLREPYGAFIYRFDQAIDHRLAGKPRMPWVPSSRGRIRINGNVSKASTPDDVLVEIIRRTTISPSLPPIEQAVLSQTLSAGSDSIDVDGMGPNNAGIELDIEANETLEFRILSDSPLDPDRVVWDPQITYLDYCRADPDTNSAICGPVSCSASPEGEVSCLIENDPSPDTPLPGSVIFQRPEIYAPVYQTLPDTPTQSLVADSGGDLEFECSFSKPVTAAPVHVLVQGVNQLIHKETFAALAPVLVSFPCGSASVNAGDQLFFTVLSDAPFAGVSFDVTLNGTPVAADLINYRYRDASFDAPVPLPGFEEVPADPFSGGFHRWFAGYYNGSLAFDENLLFFPTLGGSGFLLAAPARTGLPNLPERLWLNGAADSYIGAGILKPSRVSNTGGAGGSGGVPLVAGLRKSETYNVDFSVGAFVAGLGISTGATSSHLDFLDMNGDGYPDSVANDGVAFNNGFDGFGPKFSGLAMPGESMRRIEQRSAGASLSAGGSLINQTDSQGQTKSLLATSVNLGVNYGMSGTTKDLLDINGDGLPDHVERSGTNLRVRLNLGARFSEPIQWSAAGWAKDRISTDGVISDIAIPLIDTFLGDVSTNSVRFGDTSARTVGAGLDSNIFGVGGGAGISYTVTRNLVELVDVNGDGLPDHVMKDPNEDFLRVKLNLGDHFDEERHWPVPDWAGRDIDPGGLTFIGGADALGFQRAKSYNASFSVEVCFIACVKASGFYSKGSAFSQLEFSDLDGDGRLDHVLKLDGENEVYAKLNRLGETGLLRKVIRPLGASFTLSYKREGNEVRFDSGTAERPTVDMPSNQWVLSEVFVEDEPSQTEYLRTFRYRTIDSFADPATIGTGFRDRIERENYGYALNVTTREDLSELEVRSHNQSFYLQGLVSDTVERDADGGLFLRQEFSYRVPTGSEASITGAFFPAEEMRTTSWYEGGADIAAPGKSTSESRVWDAFGNLERLTENADDGPDDDLIYTIGYFDDPVAYIFKADNIEARDRDGGLHRKRTAVFDAGTGRLVSLTNLVTGGRNPETQASYSNTPATWTFEHDEFGNMVAVTDPLGTTTTYGYDERTETYRDFVEDAFGYQSSTVPDYRFGLPTEITDTNRNVARFLFDEWGRPLQVFGPNDQGSGDTPTIAYDYGLQPGADLLPAWARTAHKDITRSDDPEIVTVTFTDGLERVLQTKKDLERDTGSGTEVGMMVSGRVGFDARGRVSTRGQPIFSTLPDAEFVVQDEFRHPTHTEYDILSRPTLVRTPDSQAPGGFADTITSYEFGALDGRTTFMTTVEDALGNRRITHRDVDDDTIGVEEFNDIGGTEQRLVTRYTYNPVNELVQVADADNNVTSASYDTLGRMVDLASPDMGHAEWSYDLAGNLGAKQTGRLRELAQRIRYHYVNNRLERIEYPTSEDVVYVYGTPEQFGDANGNLAGRIAQEHSEAGVKSLKYDRFGNVVEHTMAFNRVRVPSQPPYEATMRYEYDSFGRLLTMRFPGPGAEEVSYNYDRGGMVTSVFGVNTEAVQPPKGNPLTFYVLFSGYDEFEQRTRLIHGNGVETRYGYDETTRRLQHIDSDHRDPRLQQDELPARPLQRLDYTYDLVGNILELRNDAPFDDSMTNVFVATTVQSFGYDKLYQLKTADGVYQSESKSRQRYSLGFDYDKIGNIVEKNQQSFRDLPNPDGTWSADQPNSDQIYRSVYTYGGPRPHAPTRIDDHLDQGQVYERELNYDASGNQTGFVYHHSDRREIDWNEEDRLSEVRQQGKKVTRVLYDGDGTRAVHVSYFGNHETAYLGQHLTIRNAVYPSKHIYIDNELVASKLDPSWFPHPPTLYFHSDHLGSAQYATNDLQELVQHDDFFPTGEVWEAQTEGRYTVRRVTRFTGKELDEGTGLYYFGARWYDPRLSQWISPDPALTEYLENPLTGDVHEPINLSVYTYAGNSPLVLVDRDGRKIQFAPNSSPQFKSEFWRAVRFLRSHNGSEVVDKLIKDPSFTVTIKERNSIQESPGFNRAENTINWSPYSATTTKAGAKRSPANRLSHEADHAVAKNTDPKAYEKRRTTKDADYGNLEEKRVITGSETRVAKKLGEGQRTGHELGNPYRVEHSDETRPAGTKPSKPPPKQAKPEKKEK